MKNEHTGQGQIIEGGSITQNKDGNWVPAQPEKYRSFLRNLLCWIGFHTWTWNLERKNGAIYFDPEQKIPDYAKCKWCDKKFTN